MLVVENGATVTAEDRIVVRSLGDCHAVSRAAVVDMAGFGELGGLTVKAANDAGVVFGRPKWFR